MAGKTAGVCRHSWYAWRRRHGVRDNLFWEDRDWAGEAQKLIEQGSVRHIGDLSLQLGLPFETLCTFAVRYRRQSKLYDLIGALPRPGGYYSGYARHITRPTIQLFNALRAKRSLTAWTRWRRHTRLPTLRWRGSESQPSTTKGAARGEARSRQPTFRTGSPRSRQRGSRRSVWSELGRLKIEKFFCEQGYTKKEIAELMRPKVAASSKRSTNGGGGWAGRRSGRPWSRRLRRRR